MSGMACYFLHGILWYCILCVCVSVGLLQSEHNYTTHLDALNLKSIISNNVKRIWQTCTRMCPALAKCVSSTAWSLWMSLRATLKQFLSNRSLRMAPFPERNFSVPTQYSRTSPHVDTSSLLRMSSNESRQ